MKIITRLVVILTVLLILAGCSGGGAPDIESLSLTNNNGWYRMSTNDPNDCDTLATYAFDQGIGSYPMEVQIRRISGYIDASFGMVFAAQPDSDRYQVSLTTDGHYAVYGYTMANNWVAITAGPWLYSSEINQGYNAINTIRVEYSSPNYSIYINDVLHTSFNRTNETTDLTGGKIGIVTNIRGIDEENFPATPSVTEYKVLQPFVGP